MSEHPLLLFQFTSWIERCFQELAGSKGVARRREGSGRLSCYLKATQRALGCLHWGSLRSVHCFRPLGFWVVCYPVKFIMPTGYTLLMQPSSAKQDMGQLGEPNQILEEGTPERKGRSIRVRGGPS